MEATPNRIPSYRLRSPVRPGDPMPFEHYDPRMHRFPVPPRIRIQKTYGRFIVNRAAFEMLGEPAFVELLYDVENDLVGFLPVAERTPRSYTLARMVEGHARTITVMRFMR